MKLNYRRTFLVGLAFMSICAFWQMYDNVIPLILTNSFKMNEVLSGIIMGADNVLALFLLPAFGALSDRCSTRIGRRMPFVIFGTAAAVILMTILPVVDNSFFSSPSETKIIFFIIVLGMLLLAMGTYRSPAVALMPDITPKPLRSKANAVINLMGALGGIIYLIITTFLYSAERTAGLAHVNYLPLFLIVAAIMIVSVLVLYLTIKENKLHQQLEEYEAAHPEENLTEDNGSGDAVLPKDVKKSLVFLLLSISCWFLGYNAVTTWFTTYASRMWDMALGQSSLCLTIGSVGAIIAYLPIGVVAGEIGRKKTIRAGVILLCTCFLCAFVLTLVLSGFSPILYVLFALVGVAWAAINVNSLPMVVEMCRGSDIGKFTGYYYTFSMAAQSLTPVISGWLIRNVSYKALFPYAAVCVALAFFTMSLVRHGDSTPEAKMNLEAFDVED